MSARCVYLCYSVDMRVISIATLRQNPTQALEDVEGGATYIVTRYNREIARLIPPVRAARVTPDQFTAALRATPVTEGWADDLRAAATDFDEPDPWKGR